MIYTQDSRENYAATSRSLPYPHDHYRIMRDGTVYNSKLDNFVQPIVHKATGFLKIRVYDGNGVRTEMALHRIVAETFVKRPVNPDARYVLHKDLDYHNCHADNLVWRTRSMLRRYHDQFDMPNLPNQRVRSYSMNDNLVPQPEGTVVEAAMRYGLLFSEIEISALNNECVSTLPDVGFLFSN